jgi:antirestriction protein
MNPGSKEAAPNKEELIFALRFCRAQHTGKDITMTARIYVGTYAKYNNGSITGGWLNCDDYSTHSEFITAACELHMGESDPELMFQDYEGFPKAFYGESYIKPELWDWLELDDSDRELLAAYQDGVDETGTIDQAFLDDTGMLSELPEWARAYFDYEAYARDAGFEGTAFVRHDGTLYVFHSR